MSNKNKKTIEKGFVSQEGIARANIMLALLRAFCDSIQGMEGIQRHQLKLKYNRLVKTSQQYIKELDNIKGLSEGHMNIYEQINDLLYEKANISTGDKGEMVEDKNKCKGDKKKGKEK